MSTEELRTRYPEIEPYDTGRLRVSDRHEIYYEQCGNPDGRPMRMPAWIAAEVS